MQKKLYLFNPDTDLALADGRANYLPPHSIRKMAEDLATLPYWYAEKDDEACILGQKGTIDSNDLDEIIPWGWNSAVCKRLTALGMPDELLPTPEQLEQIRSLSNRSFAVNLLKELLIPDVYCGSATVFFSEAEVETFAGSTAQSLLKAPWSSSGKGLRFCEGHLSEAHRQWARRILTLQGSIIGESLYNKVEDFAMEFRADGEGDVSFIGYSLFSTDEHGKYQGNFLADDEQIESVLCKTIHREDLLRIKEKLIELLPSRLGGYKGYLGVDMMICRFTEEPTFRIHPCVEVNLRMNMGIVARRIFDNYLSPNSTGTFRIDYFANPEDLAKDHQEQTLSFPLCKANGRILSGYQALTPVNGKTNYRAAIRVEETILRTRIADV